MRAPRSREFNDCGRDSISVPFTSSSTVPKRPLPRESSSKLWQKRRSTRGSAQPRGDDDDDSDGDNGNGLVLPLTNVGSSAFDSSYTVPLLIGSTRQRLYVQVDTGSADLWLASTDCSDASCPSAKRDLQPSTQPVPAISLPAYKAQYFPFIPSPTNTTTIESRKRGRSPLYNPYSSTTLVESGAPITIQYLVGQVEGMVVWDSVGLDLTDSVSGLADSSADADGMYPWTIESQALASASVLISEPLREKFSGLLGLSPPLNSIISRLISPTENGDMDGAAWSSNIWSNIGAEDDVLSARRWYVRFLFDRADGGVLGAPQAIMALGEEPPSSSYPEHYQDGAAGILADMSFTRPLASLDPITSTVIGTTYWRVSLTSITVANKPITLPSSMTAVLDTGVPTILTSRTVADGIYGAIGIGPGGDGNYYLPCSTMLSMNITLFMTTGSELFTVHPLDLTERRGGKNECMGTVQANDGITPNEVILGLAFLRSVETVFGFDGQVGVNGQGGSGGVTLGMRTLVDADVALNEWKTVRVEGSSLTGSSGSGERDDGVQAVSHGGLGKVGVVALAVLGSLAALCIVLFGLWRWLTARREKQARGEYESTAPGSPVARVYPTLPPPSREKSYLFGLIKVKLENRNNDPYALQELSEDDKRRSRYEAYLARQRRSDCDEFGVSSGVHERERTLVASASTQKDFGIPLGDRVNEEAQKGHGKFDPWDPATGLDWGGRALEERDVLLSTEGAETLGQRIPPDADATLR